MFSIMTPTQKRKLNIEINRQLREAKGIGEDTKSESVRKKFSKLSELDPKSEEYSKAWVEALESTEEE